MPRTKQNNPKNLKGEFALRFTLLCSAFSCQLVNLLIRMSGEELLTTYCWYKMCFWLKMVIDDDNFLPTCPEMWFGRFGQELLVFVIVVRDND